ncbi:MAG: hypothetical protein JXA71_12450 [Chitinispirillaceae bacterium]|nr:hypothetical protein [Chitinispirillaceae bacterium]
MRTTITIDDDILSAAHTLSIERKISMGHIISELARKGLRSGTVRYSIPGPDELPVFSVRENAPPITPAMIQSAEDEQ